MFSNQSDYTRYVNLASSSSFEATYTASLDEKVIPPLRKVLRDSAKKKFIVVHLMGSHMNYSKRYPSEYDVFKGDGSKKTRLIAHYDNSILYNDFIVDSIISIAAKASGQHASSLIYLPDHAENVYDELDKFGHDYAGVLPKVNVEIPFIVWLSPEMIKSDPIKFNALDSKLSIPFVTDDLFHSVIDLNSIQTSYLDTSRSIFNLGFNHQRKRVLEDGKDYDLK
ncbi:MAG: sulfatase-like hydrolase/transferase [Flavobacteriales bacterium]|nr:sulfatase-like hydrolase/transferase [Flavobacteriales bacterium]